MKSQSLTKESKIYDSRSLQIDFKIQEINN